jgi:hypothetical protein
VQLYTILYFFIAFKTKLSNINFRVEKKEQACRSNKLCCSPIRHGNNVQRGRFNMKTISNMSRRVMLGVMGAAMLAAMPAAAFADNAKLKIGFVGVTSGPAAAWGTSNVRSMQTLAAWYNELGGVKIGEVTYDLDIVTFDDQKDPKRASRAWRNGSEGIHYVVGPNVDDGAAAVRPVAEANGTHLLPLCLPEVSLRETCPTPCSA